jgi:hypothetical protein
MLSPGLRQVIMQRMELTGGFTNSIFPEVEELLLSESDYQQALEFVAAKKKMKRYWSMVDFLFCELVPLPWRFKCFMFYNNRGPMLKDVVDSSQMNCVPKLLK